LDHCANSSGAPMLARLYVAVLSPWTVATWPASTANDDPPAETVAVPENTVIDVVAPSGATSTRYSPIVAICTAALGASISSVSPVARERSRKIADPCGTLNWSAASSSRSTSSSVCWSSRTSADPISTSTRPALSAHSASPVVTGLLGTATAHAVSPPARNETVPPRYASRPTRPGGSPVADGLAGGSATCASAGTPHTIVMATAHAVESAR